MAQHTASRHRALRTGFLHLLLLIGIAALPAFAFAVDSDGDGVDDTGGYTTFTEGFETELNGWTLDPVTSIFGRTTTSGGGLVHTGSYAGGWTNYSGSTNDYGTFSRSLSVGSGAQISFWRYVPSLGSTQDVKLLIDGVSWPLSCSGSTSWQQCSVGIAQGTHQISIKVRSPLPFCNMGCVKVSYFVDDIAISNVWIADNDDDNDGVPDTGDAFPLDNTQAGDIDADGIDGFVDNCPSNSNAGQLNTDGDTQGNVCDSDDDNDGVTDASDKFSLNAAASSDADNDSFPGSWNAACDATCQSNSGLLLDNCPSNANADQLNTDADTQGNACDSDDDNDGVVDGSDAFPLNAAESLDTDADGIGNNADPDDDNDGLPDAMDPLPLQAKFNRDANYKGSQVRDSNYVQ